MQTSKLSHTVAYGKANKFLMSKAKGQGHIKGQNNIFGSNFGSICRTDFRLVSYCSLWEGKSCMTLTLIFDLDLNNFFQRLREKGLPWQRYVFSGNFFSYFLSVLVIYGDMRVVGL